MSIGANDQRPWVPGFRDYFPADSYGISDGEDGVSNAEFLQGIVNQIIAEGTPYQQGTGGGVVRLPFFTGNSLLFTGTINIGKVASGGSNVFFTGNRGQIIAKTDDTNFLLFNNTEGNSGNLASGVEECWIGGGVNGGGNGFANAIAIYYQFVGGNGGGIEQMVRHNYISGLSGIKLDNPLQARIIWNTVYQKNATTAFGINIAGPSGNRGNQIYCVGNTVLGSNT